MTKVLIVDDHAVLRMGLSLILETTPDFEAAGFAENGRIGLAQVEALQPDLVLCDIRMPEMDGIEMIRQLHQTHPNLPVVVLTTFDDPEPIQQAMRLGARGYLLKDADKETIVNTLKQALVGTVSLSPELMTKAFAQPRLTISLTPREHEILQQVAQGARNIDVAQELHLSERTIKAHLTSIYNRLGVESRAEAVAAALKLGLIE
jgi:NarL family two-component system response regulator YdfI